jgi:AcrR family transcriptional regulator
MAKKPHGTEPIIGAAFELAAERGWRRLALADIADRAGMPMAELVGQVASKTELLDAYARQIDQRMLEGGSEAGQTTRDRLFEVVMRRFEAMAPDRRALAIILRESGDDPWALLCGGRRFVKSMALTLETAGLSSAGLAGLARIEGLTVVYLCALRAFLEDDSPDLPRTMAALDRALRRAEGLATLLWRRRDIAATPTNTDVSS